MRKRVRREWVWIVVLAVVILFTLITSGCYSPTATAAPKKDQQSDKDKAIKKYNFKIIHLDWRGVYFVQFDGHDYLQIDEHFVHTASCPGLHGE